MLGRAFAIRNVSPGKKKGIGHCRGKGKPVTSLRDTTLLYRGKKNDRMEPTERKGGSGRYVLREVLFLMKTPSSHN